MPRTKKELSSIVLKEENEKLQSEITKAKEKIAAAEAKMKENKEKILMEQINKITTMGYMLEDVVSLLESMSLKKVSVSDIISLISDNSTTTPVVQSEAENKTETSDNGELEKMMATLPKYD